LRYNLRKIEPCLRLDRFRDYAAVPRVWMYSEEVVHLDELGLRSEGEEQGRCERYACRGTEGVDAGVLRGVGHDGRSDQQAGYRCY
jgi:hypothetical protein